MRLGTHFPSGAVHRISKQPEIRSKSAMLRMFRQLFLMVIGCFAFHLSAQAHHAAIYPEYFKRFPGLSDQMIRYPFQDVAPKSNFTRSDILRLRFLVCNRHTVPGRNRYRVLHFEERKVRIDVAPKFEFTKSSVNGLGKLGLHYAWRRCPARPALHRPSYGNIEIEIWRNNELSYRFFPARSSTLRDRVDISRLWSKWDAQRERERKRQLERQRQAQRAAAIAQKEKAAAKWAIFWQRFWIVVFLAVAAFIYLRYRGPIMAFYYHNFTKHPAEDLINRSVKGDLSVDGASLARELDRATKASNPIEAKVRADQADAIAKKAREKAAVYKAQENLADAMMDVERAKRAEQRAREALDRTKSKSKD